MAHKCEVYIGDEEERRECNTVYTPSLSLFFSNSFVKLRETRKKVLNIFFSARVHATTSYKRCSLFLIPTLDQYEGSEGLVITNKCRAMLLLYLIKIDEVCELPSGPAVGLGLRAYFRADGIRGDDFMKCFWF